MSAIMQHKILYITLRSDHGGGPKHLKDLMENRKHFEVFVASPLDKPFGRYFKENAKKHFFIPHRKFSFIKLIKLINFCKKNKIETIHSHGRGAGFYSRLMSFFGFKVIHTFHGIHISNNFLGIIKKFIDLILKYMTDHFICVSQEEFEEARSYNIVNETKTSIIYNGIDKSLIQNIAPHKVSDPIKIGTLARLNFQKGIDLLIEYADQFLNNHPNTEFYIAGDGEEEAKLKALLEKKTNKNKIKLIGNTDQPHDFLNSLDIYISFSRWEGFPLAVLEALSHNLPSLLSNKTGHGYFFEKHAALAFDLDSYKNFEENLNLLINSSEKVQNLKEAGHQLLLNELTTEKMAQNTFNLYSKS